MICMIQHKQREKNQYQLSLTWMFEHKHQTTMFLFVMVMWVCKFFLKKQSNGHYVFSYFFLGIMWLRIIIITTTSIRYPVAFGAGVDVRDIGKVILYIVAFGAGVSVHGTVEVIQYIVAFATGFDLHW